MLSKGTRHSYPLLAKHPHRPYRTYSIRCEHSKNNRTSMRESDRCSRFCLAFSSSSDHHREFITFMNILWFSSVAWQMVSSDSDRGRGIVEGTISGVTTRELRISYMLQLSYEFLLFLVTSMRTDVDTSESSHNHNAVASSSRSTPNTDLSW